MHKKRKIPELEVKHAYTHTHTQKGVRNGLCWSRSQFELELVHTVLVCAQYHHTLIKSTIWVVTRLKHILYHLCFKIKKLPYILMINELIYELCRIGSWVKSIQNIAANQKKTVWNAKCHIIRMQPRCIVYVWEGLEILLWINLAVYLDKILNYAQAQPLYGLWHEQQTFK